MSRYQPALLGGLFIGVLSSLPVVNAANLCCCLWVVTGGMLTVYLQQQGKAEPVDTTEAVLSGVIAGILGGVITTVASLLLFSTSGGMMEERMRMALDQNPQVPAEMRETILRLVAGNNAALIIAAVTIPIYAVFGLLGALLGVALFRKKVTPPPAAPA